MALDPKDFIVDTYRRPQQSGWLLGIDQGVRITHLPTGIQAQADSERSLHANKTIAMRELERRLHEHAVNEANKPHPAGMLPEPQAKAMIAEYFRRTRVRRTASNGGERPATALHAILNTLYTQAFFDGARNAIPRSEVHAANRASEAAAVDDQRT